MSTTGARACAVIGGNGFIGKEVVRQLARSGRDVLVVGRSPAKDVRLPDGVRYLAGHYEQSDTLEQIVEQAGEIVHLAYSTVPKTSFTDPLFDLNSNLPGMVKFLQRCSQAKLDKLLVVSSGGTVYGQAAYTPIDELHPLNPISPYGITKLALEKYCVMYHELTGINVCIARPANAYGPEQLAFSGQGFVATALHSVRAGQEIKVFGPNGTIRDYIHVRDVASALVALLDKGRPGEAYNVGTGKGHSNLDVLHLIRDVVAGDGLAPRWTHEPERPFDVRSNVLDSRKLSAQVGWHISTSMQEGLQEMWDAINQSATAAGRLPR